MLQSNRIVRVVTDGHPRLSRYKLFYESVTNHSPVSTLTQQLADGWGTRAVQTIGTVVVLGFGMYYLLSDAGTFDLAGGVVLLAVGTLMLYDLLVE